VGWKRRALSILKMHRKRDANPNKWTTTDFDWQLVEEEEEFKNFPSKIWPHSLSLSPTTLQRTHVRSLSITPLGPSTYASSSLSLPSSLSFFYCLRACCPLSSFHRPVLFSLDPLFPSHHNGSDGQVARAIVFLFKECALYAKFDVLFLFKKRSRAPPVC